MLNDMKLSDEQRLKASYAITAIAAILFSGDRFREQEESLGTLETARKYAAYANNLWIACCERWGDKPPKMS